MASSDWNRFSKWLEGYQTEEVQKLDELLEKYYADGNPEIEWWKDAKWKPIVFRRGYVILSDIFLGSV